MKPMNIRVTDEKVGEDDLVIHVAMRADTPNLTRPHKDTELVGECDRCGAEVIYHMHCRPEGAKNVTLRCLQCALPEILEEGGTPDLRATSATAEDLKKIVRGKQN